LFVGVEVALTVTAGSSWQHYLAAVTTHLGDNWSHRTPVGDSMRGGGGGGRGEGGGGRAGGWVCVCSQGGSSAGLSCSGLMSVGDGGTQVERRRKSSKDAILERVDEKPVMLGVCIKGVLPCGSTQY